jgi:hypothetical protein
MAAPHKSEIYTDKEKARVPVGRRAVYSRIEITIQKFKIHVKSPVAF